MNNESDPYNPPFMIGQGYALLFALLPWSVEADFGAWNLTLPSEPLILALGLAVAWEVWKRPSGLIKPGNDVVKIISMLLICWMAVCACFSTMPIVSAKYWLVEAGHWWVFAAGMILWPGLWQRVLPWFVWSMLGVVVYTIIHHSYYDFRTDQALLAPMPFFPDHTMYAAVLALLLFFLFIPGGASSLYQNPVVKKWIGLVFLAAIILSTCRAALLSVGISGLVLAVVFYRKKLPFLAPAILVSGLLLYGFTAEKISKILADDVSFQEHLNRWDCAESMACAHPWTGFGPGTYPFQYLPFQQPEKMTRISSQIPLTQRGPDNYGRGGSAHSEYWQAASEMGWPGLAIWITLVITTLGAGFRTALRSEEAINSITALLITTGLLTFFIHTLANNFLHDGRVAALVWGGIVTVGFKGFRGFRLVDADFIDK